MEPSSLRIFTATVFFVLFCSPHFASSLSLDDSFLSSSSKNQQSLKILTEKSIPGIWKLTTDALPYEPDIRSKLNERFSREKNRNEINDGETILLKLNQDGTFKQCDEGYREGRWVTGRWKLQMLESTKKSSNNDVAGANQLPPVTAKGETAESGDHGKTFSWLLLLAMNRQYFGPPYDVLLEAITNTTSASVNEKESYSSSRKIVTDKEESVQNKNKKKEVDSQSKPSSSTMIPRWQGVVRKGKFLRPAPGKHPLDRARISTKNEVLEDSESLGTFSLEQALSTSMVDGKQRAKSDDEGFFASDRSDDLENPNDSSTIVDDNDGTFFFPCSSPDDGGVLQ